MASSLTVHLLPSLTTAQDLGGGVVVVIDVLRASTTICQALAAGARAVIPCLEVDEARRTAERFAAGEVVLGGERQGVRIDGFALGNSPAEYTKATVGGRTVVFSTTNGTKAMHACRLADAVWIGAFVNFSAVLHRLRAAAGQGRPLHLLCAGTDGRVTGEDVLFAGALVTHWHESQGRPPGAAALSSGGGPVSTSLRRAPAPLSSAARQDDSTTAGDGAEIASRTWRRLRDELAPAGGGAFPPASALSQYLAERTPGGRNLAELGFTADIVAAAEVDGIALVPELDLQTWTITADHEWSAERARMRSGCDESGGGNRTPTR